MRETYRQVRGRAQVPPNAALIRLWRQDGRAVADVDFGDAGTAPRPTDPDMALLMASLALAHHDLTGLFVLIEDPALWDEHWGNLVRC
jgi:hypothetical protein